MSCSRTNASRVRGELPIGELPFRILFIIGGRWSQFRVLLMVMPTVTLHGYMARLECYTAAAIRHPHKCGNKTLFRVAVQLVPAPAQAVESTVSRHWRAGRNPSPADTCTLHVAKLSNASRICTDRRLAESTTLEKFEYCELTVGIGPETYAGATRR